MSTSRHTRLLEPISIGPLRLPNRMVMGGMHTLLERLDRPTERLVAFYQARAAGEIGLIITGAHGITAEGRLDAEAAVFSNESTLAEHRAVVDAVHDLSGRIVLQLIHAGRYAKVPECVSASDRRARINRYTPRRLTTPQVWDVVEAFATSAALARRAGYDGVEIMGAEGYLINEFLAPVTNDRTDEFAGDLEGRLRFAVEVVGAVRGALGPDAALLYRISAVDLVEGGMTGSETLELAQRVAAAGADALNTGVGWHESGVPTIAAAVPRAAWAFVVRRLRDAVEIPVIAANRINDPDVAEVLLADGTADLVAMARPLLADPDFARKVRLGDTEAIAPCIACNQACLDRMFADQPVTCMINPAAGRELEFLTPRPAVRQRIAVVGAGPAGMAYAAVAAERGHDVTLYDAALELGGQWNLARLVPGKTEFDQALRYYGNRLTRAGVRLSLGVRVSAADLAAAGYEHVVVATGVVPRVPDIPGITHASVTTYAAVLTGEVKAGPRVAIIGAGGIGYDVAEFLLGDHAESLAPAAFAAAWGVTDDMLSPGGVAVPSPERARHEVTIFQRGSARFGTRLGRTTGWILRARLARHGLREIGGVHYAGIDDDGLHYELDGQKHKLPVDTVIVCAGQDSDRSLYDEFTALDLPTTLIGGAHHAAELDAVRAIEEATRAALAL